jgi:hypothetical protein
MGVMGVVGVVGVVSVVSVVSVITAHERLRVLELLLERVEAGGEEG